MSSLEEGTAVGYSGERIDGRRSPVLQLNPLLRHVHDQEGHAEIVHQDEKQPDNQYTYPGAVLKDIGDNLPNKDKEAKVGAIMNSYNLLNGVHATQNNHLNNEILKKEWGFDGILMSDWESTHDGIGAANGGLDLEMPSSAFMNQATHVFS